MNRRQFLESTATAGTVGLLAGCLNSEASENESTTENGSETATTDENTPTTDEPTETETATSTPDDTTTETTDDGDSIGEGTTTEPDRSGEGSWANSGSMDGIEFEFSSEAPACGQERNETDIEFDTDTGEVLVEGIISGSDLCKRAQLADLMYDREESHLTIAVEAVDREDVEACAQCIAEIAYKGRFSFEEEIPESASVNHNGHGVASAAHGSVSADPPSETTDE
ncbi:twin-arginine translocation signal domain-containing protein [Halorhabdus amylolytica]|uniref:twin-arginine translocation signal domain-containing protein n=1 Tax=Halorhabdus amylolytica TaxID=2559573 RepID=UPI0010AA2D64|nr:twin-arginine translocation signal domain-containing protein [Halorhabdus amylolytica]